MTRILLAALTALALLAPARADDVTYPTYPATAVRQADGSVLVTVDAPAAAALLCPIVQAPAAVPSSVSPPAPFVVRGDVQVGAAIWVYVFRIDGDGATYLGSATAIAPPYRQYFPGVFNE